MKKDKVALAIVIVCLIITIWFLIATLFLTIGTMKYSEASKHLIENGIDNKLNKIESSAEFWSNCGRIMLLQQVIK